MFDAVNRLRNFTGNYRFVSYQMRLWDLKGRLGISHENTENRLLFKALRHYQNPHPWNTLDLGSGGDPRNPFGAEVASGCDIREDLSHNVVEVNLALKAIPFAPESMDFVTAYEFIEHMLRVLIYEGRSRFPFVDLMSEIHRVLKPGGLFYARTPAWPSEEAFQDPTHVNFITKNTFPYYFCWHPYGGPWARIYGFKGRFTLVAQRRKGPYLFSLLKKI